MKYDKKINEIKKNRKNEVRLAIGALICSFLGYSSLYIFKEHAYNFDPVTISSIVSLWVCGTSTAMSFISDYRLGKKYEKNLKDELEKNFSLEEALELEMVIDNKEYYDMVLDASDEELLNVGIKEDDKMVSFLRDYESAKQDLFINNIIIFDDNEKKERKSKVKKQKMS